MLYYKHSFIVKDHWNIPKFSTFSSFLFLSPLVSLPLNIGLVQDELPQDYSSTSLGHYLVMFDYPIESLCAV